MKKRFTYVPKPEDIAAPVAKKGAKKKSIKATKKGGKSSNKSSPRNASPEPEVKVITEVEDEIRTAIEYECNETMKKYRRLFRIGTDIITEYYTIATDAYNYMNEESDVYINIFIETYKT